jgi:glycerate 2-kinase
MQILISPNAFKNAASTFEVCKAIEKGILTSNPDFEVKLFPLSDGGNDFMEVMHFYKGGEKIIVSSYDPLGRDVEATLVFEPKEKLAIIEMAQASGLHLLKPKELNPLKASSYGTGILIKKALVFGANQIVIGIGGTATVDGGMGLLAALGVEFLDADYQKLLPNGANLIRIAHINTSNLDQRIRKSSLTIACDVNNPLLGENGAARIFGPQKGATAEMVHFLEHGLENLNAVTKTHLGIDLHLYKGGGAAGGAGAVLQGYLGGKVVNGTTLVLEAGCFADHLESTDILITAEGGLDGQTFDGKAPYIVAGLAKERGIKTIALAGRISHDFYPKNELEMIFDHSFEIASNEYDNLSQAIAHTLPDLEKRSSELPLFF